MNKSLSLNGAVVLLVPQILGCFGDGVHMSVIAD